MYFYQKWGENDFQLPACRHALGKILWAGVDVRPISNILIKIAALGCLQLISIAQVLAQAVAQAVAQADAQALAQAVAQAIAQAVAQAIAQAVAQAVAYST